MSFTWKNYIVLHVYNSSDQWHWLRGEVECEIERIYFDGIKHIKWGINATLDDQQCSCKIVWKRNEHVLLHDRVLQRMIGPWSSCRTDLAWSLREWNNERKNERYNCDMKYLQWSNNKNYKMCRMKIVAEWSNHEC